MSQVMQNSKIQLAPSGLGITVAPVLMCAHVKLTRARNLVGAVLRAPGLRCVPSSPVPSLLPREVSTVCGLVEAAGDPHPFSEAAVCVTPEMVLPFSPHSIRILA